MTADQSPTDRAEPVELPADQLVEVLLDLAESFARSPSFEASLTNICEIGRDVLRCDRSSIFLRKGDYYLARFNAGNPPDVQRRFEGFRVRLDDPLISAAVAQGGPLTINDVPSSPLVDASTARVARIRAIVVAPFFDEAKEPTGYITAEFNERLGSFRPLAARLMLGIANLVEVARRSERERQHLANAGTERRRLEERLRRSERLEAIGRLAGGIAHDFNNLLTAISGNADLLVEDVGAELKPLVHDIQAASQRGASLTGQLLALGRGQMMEPRGVDLLERIEPLVSLLQRTIREDIHIEVVAAPDLALVYCDPSQLEQILMNLILNARDAISGAGRIRLEARNVDLDAAYCAQYPEAHEGPAIALCVSDTGSGLEPESIEHLFEPFYTGHPGQGTGMGLATVYGIARQSGGHVTVESSPSEGSRFCVYLPLASSAELSVAESPRPTGGRGAGETVICIDDDPAVRSVVARSLRHHGYEALEAASPAEVFALVRESEQPIAALVTDLVMPTMDGRELATAVRQLQPDIKLLWMSGYAQSPIAAPDGELQQGSAHLAKPFSGRQLAAELRRLLDAEEG